MAKITSSNNDWVHFKPGYPAPYDPFQDDEDYYLDEQAGQEAIDFFPTFLCHIHGEKALEPFHLEVWQQAIVGHVFGWKHRKTHLRRYREALILIPRKNGKSLLVSGISLYCLFCQRERGQQLYAAAGDRQQARLVHDVSKAMVLRDPDLSKRAEVLRNEIRYPDRDSFFRVLSSETSGAHGFNSSMIVLDELHVLEREFVNVLATSVGARREPLILAISTSGFDQTSVCFEKYQYAKGVRDGHIGDPAFFPVLYEAPPEADWKDPEVWAAVNPNLGVSISHEYLERECQRAQESPAFESVFKRLHLNIWTEAASPYISLTDWDACQGEIPDLSGRPCFGGLDLSATQDLTSFALCFPPQEDGEPFHVLSWSWLPEDTARAQRRKPYLQWIQEEHLTAISGAVIEHEVVLEKILQLKSQYEIVSVAFDRWGAEAVRQALEAEGVVMVGHGQGFKDQNGPTKELLKLVLSRKLRHDGDPVLRWAISNLTVEQDAAGNLKPSKRKSSEKIDPVVALIMALAGGVSHEAPMVSMYEGMTSEEIRDRMCFR